MSGTVISNYTSVIHIMSLTIVPKQFTDQLLCCPKKELHLNVMYETWKTLIKVFGVFVMKKARCFVSSFHAASHNGLYLCNNSQIKNVFCLANAEYRLSEFRFPLCTSK